MCGACTCPKDECSFVRGGTTKPLLYNLPRGVGVGCLRVLKKCFVCMVRVALSLAAVGTKPSCARDRLYIAKTEMAVRCSGVGGEKVGVECGCMQGCCVGVGLGVISLRMTVQVAASTKTSRVSAVARQS